MRSKSLVFVVVLTLAAVAVVAETIPNWPAPPTWTPPRTGGVADGRENGLTNPIPFIPVTPCRMVDTRNAAGPYGGPALVAGATRNFTAAGQCGLPAANIGAVSFNATVTSTAGAGFITMWPAGGAMPTVSTLNYVGGQTLANAAIVPLSAAGALSVVAGVSGTHFILDVNGYYPDEYIASTEYFAVRGAYSGGGVLYASNSATGNGSAAVRGYESGTNASGTEIAGVLGEVSSTVNGASGVWGHVASWGQNVNFMPAGVRGEGAANGVVGAAEDRAVVGVLVDATTHNWLAEGQLGKSGSSATQNFGVVGYSSGSSVDYAAVLGRVTGTEAQSGLGSSWVGAGVRGEGYVGVWGFSNHYGVFGRAYTTSNVNAGWGVLGYNLGATTYGVYGANGSSGTTNWAIFAGGSYGGTGAKYFVEPHPYKAGTTIRYVALEGPEAGTYFRGKGQFVGRRATINVPETFRLVTDPEGLTIQVTPVGDFASVAIVSIDLYTIELKATKDVEFHYLVNGIRHTFKDLQVEVQSDEFMPLSGTEKIPDYLAPEQKRYLIQNGTYNQDGTPNLEMARKLGWDRIWEVHKAANTK